MKNQMMFVYAWRGLKAAWKTECNFRIHAMVALVVIGFAFYFRVSATEWGILLLCIGGVCAAELLNTAIEKLTDANFSKKDTKAAFIKDVAAGAVLLMSLVAAICGVLVFIRYF
ncbi:MAG: diacylglycerol kinase family protein [Bacteroidota bacterium]|jgi:diacylglycerol kinase